MSYITYYASLERREDQLRQVGERRRVALASGPGALSRGARSLGAIARRRAPRRPVVTVAR